MQFPRERARIDLAVCLKSRLVNGETGCHGRVRANGKRRQGERARDRVVYA